MTFDGPQWRAFVALMAGAIIWPLAGHAQQPMPVVGFLNGATAHSYEPYLSAFHRGLKEIGYIEGTNVALEYRWAEGYYDRLPALAQDLVARRVSVIAATGGSPPALAAKASTTTIPIVFRTGFDPVAVGLVTSLAHPGGNITGVATLSGELGQKQLALLHELVPAARTIGLLVNPASPTLAENMSRDVRAAADSLGIKVEVMNASTDSDLDAAFEALVQHRIGALVIGADGFFFSRSERLAALALRHSIAAVYQYRDFVAAGGLMSYAGSFADAYRLVGQYTGRILKGEKPADLPVQLATRLELIINLKTARALGLALPPTLLVSADEIIE